MGFLIWLIVGGIVGWLASLVMRTDGQQGILLNVVVGIVGAFIGGWVISPLVGVGTINEGISIGSVVVSLIGAVMVMIAGIANFFIQSSALMLTVIVLAIGIFSAFILHDLKRVRDGDETNYISATLGVYLSLFNVFQSLLALLGIFGGSRE